MATITKQELDRIISEHKIYLKDNSKIEFKANLIEADLSGADLYRADLREADLYRADLRGANLRGANLRGANLSRADLYRADLREADLYRADLDYVPWNLSCKGLNVHIDDKIAIQLLFHTVQNALHSKNTSERVKQILSNKELINLANEFHRDEINRI